jgi:hypothetical protein
VAEVAADEAPGLVTTKKSVSSGDPITFFAAGQTIRMHLNAYKNS